MIIQRILLYFMQPPLQKVYAHIDFREWIHYNSWVIGPNKQPPPLTFFFSVGSFLRVFSENSFDFCDLIFDLWSPDLRHSPELFDSIIRPFNLRLH